MSKINVTSQASVTCIKVSDGTQPGCISSPTFAVSPLTAGVTAKIPVTLAELTVQVNMSSFITLPEPALEIKDIKKRVKVTQCLLLQPTNVLFIKGFVRKNIDYATRGCSNSEGVCGDIRHCTVDVPFRCSTTVTFNSFQTQEPVPNSSNEFEFFRKQQLRGPGFSEKDQLLSGDLSEFNQVSEEFFNELPFCELINARIVEYNEYLNRRRPKGVLLPFEEKEFRQVEEKMVLYITLKLLQNRQVAIPPCDLNAFGCYDFDCSDTLFTCLAPFNCGNNFDCHVQFACFDSIFHCAEPFDCETPFQCPIKCDNPFMCEENFI